MEVLGQFKAKEAWPDLLDHLSPTAKPKLRAAALRAVQQYIISHTLSEEEKARYAANSDELEDSLAEQVASEDTDAMGSAEGGINAAEIDSAADLDGAQMD